jgi:hypothetical protein
MTTVTKILQIRERFAFSWRRVTKRRSLISIISPHTYFILFSEEQIRVLKETIYFLESNIDKLNKERYG